MQVQTSVSNFRSGVGRNVAIVLLLWFLGAVAVGLSGIYYGVPAPVVGLTNGALTLVTLLLLLRIASLREWVDNLPIRTLVLYHTIRFVGVAFLLLYSSGAIPNEFALAAGWGDIFVAATALVVAFVATPIASKRDWSIVLVWNLIGLADILMVLVSAIRIGITDYEQVVVISDFPMSLLPTFVVPLILVTHVLIFRALAQAKKDIDALATG